MYQITKEKEYLEQAISMYTWLTEDSSLIDEDGFIYDGFGANEDKQTAKNKIVWSYNSGTFIGGLKELYSITKNKKYF
jgi:predicted alpha-1,6-mannanase (GH76 family)